jgi:segregation and condensation protein A
MSTMFIPEEHKVQLDVFDGPLDLLLYLIKKDEIDIHDIPISQVTDQYMEYLDLMRMLDLNIAGEFIVMAATLMLIKSRMLLPVEDRPEIEDEEEDPRWELVRQLIEYRKFKEAASFLQDKERRQENSFLLGAPGVELEPERGLSSGGVSIFDLISAFNQCLKDAPTDQFTELFSASFSVADKIEAVLESVRELGSMPFSRLFQEMAVRQEIACTFLALLELIRLRQVRVTQDSRFGEIMISKME